MELSATPVGWYEGSPGMHGEDTHLYLPEVQETFGLLAGGICQ